MTAVQFKPLVLSGDPDWIQPQFWIMRHEVVENGNWLALGCAASHGGRDLGFRLMFPLLWQPRIEDSPRGQWAAIVCFFEFGAIGDAFVQTLADLWGVAPPIAMARKSEFWAGGNERTGQQVLAERVNVFLETGDPGSVDNPWGQMHLAIDLSLGTLQICEREPDYPPFRQAIIHALAQGSRIVQPDP